MVKKVTFNEAANVKYDDSFTRCERKRMFYDKHEICVLRQEYRGILELLVSKGINYHQNQQTCCFRGLERACPICSKERAPKIRSFVRAVLDQYETLRDMGLSNCDRLTEISSTCSRNDVEHALNVARMDALKAIGVWRTTRTTSALSSPLESFPISKRQKTDQDNNLCIEKDVLPLDDPTRITSTNPPCKKMPASTDGLDSLTENGLAT